MEQFLSNEFHWMYRQRIRVTIVQPSPSVSASSSSTSIGLVNNNCLSPAVLKNALENDIDAMDTDACTCTKDHETQTCEQKFRFNF